MPLPAITFENVSKSYRLGARRSGLRELISGLTNRRDGDRVNPDNDETLWALRDVSFVVQPGEALGIIGPNGAGKTTTLKLLAGITRPSSGDIIVRGRIASLIELGAGFHPELTGRENIFLNATVLGLSRKEIERRLDDIVAFSGLERFIDTPVKRYSSGMYARLGFSVAAHIDPDVLLVDEVLSVGDVAFQERCWERMHVLTTSGATVIFVSHSLPAVYGLCARALWLHEGRVVRDGPAREVCTEYMQDAKRRIASSNETSATGRRISSDQSVLRLKRARLVSSQDQVVEEIPSGAPARLELEFVSSKRIQKPTVGIEIVAANGATVLGTHTGLDNCNPDYVDSHVHVTCSFDALTLQPGWYTITVYAADKDLVYGYDRVEHAIRFRVVDDEYLIMRMLSDADILRCYGVVRLDHTWRIVGTNEC